MQRRCLTWMILGCAAAPAAAQGTLTSPTAPTPPTSFFEVGGFYHHVSDGFGSWKGGYARAVLAGAHNVWYADAKAQEAFRDRGVYGSLTNVHDFGPRFYTQLGVGAGTGQYVLPKFRVDGSLNLKLGATRALVVSVGGMYLRAQETYSDQALFGSLFWYAGAGALVELGGRVNWSDPGAVRSERVSGSVTLGRSGKALLVLRGGAGTEGYQLLGTPETLRKFRSQEATLSWRQWLSRQVGMVLGGEWYHNPFYTRTGVSLGLFRAW